LLLRRTSVCLSGCWAEIKNSELRKCSANQSTTKFGRNVCYKTLQRI